MKLLALDASTAICTVALENDGDVFQLSKDGFRTHSQFILTMIDKCMHEANIQLSELNACVFGQGPGSFTGLRLVASITQALAFSHSLKVVPISSLLAYAQTIYALEKWNNVLVCEDARIQQVYWAHCQVIDGVMQFITSEQCTVPEKLIEYLSIIKENQSITLIGAGWVAYPQLAAELQHSAMKFTDTISIATGLLQLGDIYLKQKKVVTDETAFPSYVQTLQYHKK